MTPFGYFHPSCVQSVDESETLRSDGSIRRADGSTREVAACTHPAFLRDGTRVEPNDESNRMLRQPSTYNGYLQLVSATESSGANKLTADMTVPPNPSSVAGQTLYLFPGLEDYQNVVTILQPVLGWNGFGDNAWTITSWNCCKSGTTYHGNHVSVKAGDLIVTSMNNPSAQTWTIAAKDSSQSGSKSAVLKTSGYNQTFDWIFAGALETYGVSSCSQFPASGPIAFTKITPYIGGSVVSNPAWTIQGSTGSPGSCTSANIVNATTVDINY